MCATVVSSLHIFHCMSKGAVQWCFLVPEWGAGVFFCCLNKTNPYHKDQMRDVQNRHGYVCGSHTIRLWWM